MIWSIITDGKTDKFFFFFISLEKKKQKETKTETNRQLTMVPGSLAYIYITQAVATQYRECVIVNGNI